MLPVNIIMKEMITKQLYSIMMKLYIHVILVRQRLYKTHEILYIYTKYIRTMATKMQCFTTIQAICVTWLVSP